MSASIIAAAGPLLWAEPGHDGAGWSLGTRVVVYLLVLIPAAAAAAGMGAALATGAAGAGGGGRVVLRLAGYLAVLAVCFGAAYALGSWTRPGWLR